MLSRIESIQKLHLKTFLQSKITTCPQALAESKSMKAKVINLKTPYWLREEKEHIKVFTLNIRSLNKHFPDIAHDQMAKVSDFICLTETQLNNDQILTNLQLDNFSLIHS